MTPANVHTVPIQTVVINGKRVLLQIEKDGVVNEWIMRVSAVIYEGGECVAVELNGTNEVVDGVTQAGRRVSIEDYRGIDRL